MSIETVLRNITPKQQGAIQNKIEKSGVFEIGKTGHVDVRKRSKIKDFPRYHGHHVCVGYVGEHKKVISALLSNTNLKVLKPYHDELRKIYESVRNLGVN